MSVTLAEETVRAVFYQPQSQIDSRHRMEEEAARAHAVAVEKQAAINEQFSSLAKRFPEVKFLQKLSVR